MTRATISDPARADLQNIANYSAARWGKDRAVSYRVELNAAFAQIAEYPEVGKRLPNLGANIRQIVRESHVIVYDSVSEDEILILRVVHARRRITRRLLFESDST